MDEDDEVPQDNHGNQGFPGFQELVALLQFGLQNTQENQNVFAEENQDEQAEPGNIVQFLEIIQEQIARINPPNLQRLLDIVKNDPPKSFVKQRTKKVYNYGSHNNHVQCANAIVCPDFGNKREDFLVINGTDSLSCVNLMSEELEFKMSLNFSPISLASNFGYVAAGGPHGELLVFSMKARKILNNDPVCESMIYSLEIIKQNGTQKILMGLGTGKIKVLGLPLLDEEPSIGPFPGAVKCLKISPNGKYLAAVGDFPSIIVIPYDNVIGYGESYKLEDETAERVTAWIRGATGSFVEESAKKVHNKVCWNHDSTLVATSSDSHYYISVWDVVSKKIFIRVDSGRSTFGVQFSHIAKDTLIFSNRLGHIHLVNLYYQTRQFLEFPKNQNITGFCLSPNSKKLFVGLSSLIVEYEMNHMKTLQELCCEKIRLDVDNYDVDWSVLPRSLLPSLFPPRSLKEISFAD